MIYEREWKQMQNKREVQGGGDRIHLKEKVVTQYQ